MGKSSVQLIGHYAVEKNSDVSLIEIFIDKRADEIDLVEFTQEIENESRAYWQVPFDEKYLNLDGNKIIGDDIDLPTEITNKTRVTFYIYFIDVSKPLITPFGPLRLIEKTEPPKRIKDIIVFNDPE